MQETNNNEITTTLIRDLLKEKRADRRSKYIRSILWLLLMFYIFFSIFRLFGPQGPTPPLASKYAALIRLDGMIAPGRDLSSNEILPIVKQAFEDKDAVGVIIVINSPGGTPVQAAIIHDALNAFKHKYHKKLVVVGEDLLTSGAYYVAVAADKIYVNPNTITGSVGVIMKGFGFVDAIKKLGIERRVYTAGDNKDRLDPFLPQNPEDLKKIQQVMSEVHKNFVDAVLTGRKNKLKADPSILFSGDFWSGQTALTLGLVDGLGNLTDVLDKEFNTSRYKEYNTGGGLFRLLGGQISSAFDTMLYSFLKW
jgi:protease-4